MTDHMKETERLLEQYDDACLGIIGMSEEQARAALLAHIQRGAVPEAWKEATIAWEVCASIHREYAKKKDPFFTTRQADFVRRTEAARAALLATAPDNFRDATKMVAEPAEVPMPQGYAERPSDYTGDIWIESQMRAYGDAREAAGYARGLNGDAPAEVPMPKPVAYGFGNTAITGHTNRLMMVRIDIPGDDQYAGAFWLPLVLSDEARTYGDAREAAGYARGLAEAGRDAERYRWLRDVSVPPHNFYLSVPDEFAGVRYAPTEVDAAIDASIDALRGEVK